MENGKARQRQFFTFCQLWRGSLDRIAEVQALNLLDCLCVFASKGCQIHRVQMHMRNKKK